MKKIMTFCAACLLLLSGCTGGQEAASPSPTASVPPSATPLAVETAAVSPTPTPAEIAAPVVTEAPVEIPPVETVEPEEDKGWDGSADTLTLNDFPTQLSGGGEVAEIVAEQSVDGAALFLIAQIPESDTWLYGVCGPGQESSLILRVGARWEQFDIPFLPPAPILPQIYYGDFDGDMTLELALLTCGGGADVSVCGLNVVEFGDGGGWSALAFDPADYTAILDQSVGCAYDPETNVATLQAGESSLTLNFTDWGYPEPGEPVTAACGGAVSFTVDGDAIYGSFSVGVDAPNVPAGAMSSVAGVSADVVYTGSAFGLDALAFGAPEN